MTMATLSFACPACHAALSQSAPDEMLCPTEGLHFRRIEGIWRFLLPERTAHYERFVREYETVRRAEGRGAAEPAYYRALPYKDLSGQMRADWRIRAVSFDALLDRVVAPLERDSPRMRVLDLGAGNGWLSNRLAERGHAVAAVDLLTNDFDGLGCYRQYTTAFQPIQTEFDRLPLLDGQTDLLIFNASLHYSVDIRATLREALRVLGPQGCLVILDSPVYRDARSGMQMVAEREAQFVRRFGFASNALSSQNFLTYQQIGELGAELGVTWRLLTPGYGLGWALKPLKATLLGRREPAKFHLIVGEPLKAS